MDASCGPGNALSQLSKHTQRDTSLQHEHSGFAGHNGRQQAFRNGPGIDSGLNQEFQQFSQGGPSAFQPQLQNMGSLHGGHNLHPQNLHLGGQPQEQMGRNQGWVQDFGGLSIRGQQGHAQENITHLQNHQNQQSHQKPGTAATADWHQQFMQNMKQQQQQNQSQQQYQPMMGQMNQMGQMGYMSQMGQMNQMNQAQYQQQNQQSNLRDLQVDEQALSRQFDMIEKELAQESLNSETIEKVVPELNHDNEGLADAARQVHASMTGQNAQQSQETAQKFQQSSFLKLMTSISEREVELSKDGDKLVSTTTGADIREHLSDPLRHERGTEEPTYHEPQHEHLPGIAGISAEPRSTNESENIRSHLPDPLAHIKDGDLNGDFSSLETARVISGGQVQGNSWMEDEMWDAMGGPTGPRTRPSLLSPLEQEVYDDYRNDDY